MTVWFTRAMQALAAAILAGGFVAAEESPSTPWSPPGSSSPTAATTADSTPTPATDELPAPSDSESSANLFGGPALLQDDMFDEDEPTWHSPLRWVSDKPWDTALELGLNGSSGNDQSFSIRTGGYVKRESRFSKFDYRLYYNRTTTNKETTQDNATTDIRNDWLLDDSSPWSLFAKANLFYDQFQAFDLQTNGSSGIGFQVFKDPMVDLSTRVGAGASREFGGPDNDWTPEALFGFEYEQHVSDSQKLSATLEYYPQFDNFGKYRLVADAGWEIELDKPSNLSLKMSANDRFDSTPNGVEPHLVNYSVLLLLKL
jgi:putative salt-induced outer membrane protein YdiY